MSGRMVFPSDQYPTVSVFYVGGSPRVSIADAHSEVTLTMPEAGNLMRALGELARAVADAEGSEVPLAH